MAAKIQDRIYRSRNLFIYGIAEVNNDAAHDLQYTTQVLSRIPGIDLSGLIVRHIPSKRVEEPRPLVVRLMSHDDDVQVLCNCRLLPQGILPRADRTEAERAELRSLSIAIKQHNAANPNNRKRIAYIKGVPTAVFVKKNPRQRKI